MNRGELLAAIAVLEAALDRLTDATIIAEVKADLAELVAQL